MPDNVTPIKRDGKQQPRTRGGGKGVRRSSARQGAGILNPKTAIEENAPGFKTQREYDQWKAGKLSRGEVIEDFLRIKEGLVNLYSQIDMLQGENAMLRKQLAERGHIDMAKHKELLATHVGLKQLLDSFNFGPAKEGTTWDMKVEALLDWNAEHPEMIAVGGYLHGLAEFLQTKEEDGGFSLVRRFEVAGALRIPEEAVLTEEELTQVAEELKNRPIDVEAEADEELAAAVKEEQDERAARGDGGEPASDEEEAAPGSSGGEPAAGAEEETTA